MSVHWRCAACVQLQEAAWPDLNHLHVDLDVRHEDCVLIEHICRDVRKDLSSSSWDHPNCLWLDAGQRVCLPCSCLSVRHDGSIVPIEHVLHNRLDCCLVYI